MVLLAFTIFFDPLYGGDPIFVTERSSVIVALSGDDKANQVPKRLLYREKSAFFILSILRIKNAGEIYTITSLELDWPCSLTPMG